MKKKDYILLWISLIFLETVTIKATEKEKVSLANKAINIIKDNPKTSAAVATAGGLALVGTYFYNKHQDKKKVEILNLNANPKNDKLNLESNQSKNEAYSSIKEEVKKIIKNKESRIGIKHKVIKKTLRKSRANHKIRQRARR